MNNMSAHKVTISAEIQAQLEQLCSDLQLPVSWETLLDQGNYARQQQMSHENYLTHILNEIWQEKIIRRTERRIKEAHFPFCKTLEHFDFNQSPHLPETRIRALAEHGYIQKAEAVLLVGEPGTGKTHIAIALGYLAAQAGYRVKFITLANLATQLKEAKDHHRLSMLIKRYAQVDLLILDELGYTPLCKTDAELVFQVLGERQERKPVIVTTNLPFSEWTNVFTDPRLCKAILDRLIHHAHIIETGNNSARLANT